MERPPSDKYHFSVASKYCSSQNNFSTLQISSILSNRSSSLKTSFTEQLIWNEKNDFLRLFIPASQSEQSLTQTVQFYSKLHLVTLPRFSSFTEGHYILERTRKKLKVAVANSQKNDFCSSDSNRLLHTKDFASSESDRSGSKREESPERHLNQREDSLTKLIACVNEVEKLLTRPVIILRKFSSNSKIKRKARRFVKTPIYCHSQESNLNKLNSMSAIKTKREEVVSKFKTPKYEAVEEQDAGNGTKFKTKIRLDSARKQLRYG